MGRHQDRAVGGNDFYDGVYFGIVCHVCVGESNSDSTTMESRVAMSP